MWHTYDISTAIASSCSRCTYEAPRVNKKATVKSPSVKPGMFLLPSFCFRGHFGNGQVSALELNRDPLALILNSSSPILHFGGSSRRFFRSQHLTEYTTGLHPSPQALHVKKSRRCHAIVGSQAWLACLSHQPEFRGSGRIRDCRCFSCPPPDRTARHLEDK